MVPLLSIYFLDERRENPENGGEFSLICSHSAFETSRERTLLQGQNLFSALLPQNLESSHLAFIRFCNCFQNLNVILSCVAGGVSGGIWSQV